jgi:hypothetical protein
MEATSHNIGHKTVEFNDCRRILYLSHSADLPRHGKQFYVYCTEAIDLTKAVVAADEERTSRGDADFAKQQREIVRRAIRVNPSELINPLLPALDSIINNKK